MRVWLYVGIAVLAAALIAVRLGLLTRAGRRRWREVWHGSLRHKVFVAVVLVAALGLGLWLGSLRVHH